MNKRILTVLATIKTGLFGIVFHGPLQASFQRFEIGQMSPVPMFRPLKCLEEFTSCNFCFVRALANSARVFGSFGYSLRASAPRIPIPEKIELSLNVDRIMSSKFPIVALNRGTISPSMAVCSILADSGHVDGE
jgi:hypothetical protein